MTMTTYAEAHRDLSAKWVDARHASDRAVCDARIALIVSVAHRLRQVLCVRESMIGVGGDPLFDTISIPGDLGMGIVLCDAGLPLILRPGPEGSRIHLDLSDPRVLAWAGAAK
jgi:hypothetical protein